MAWNKTTEQKQPAPKPPSTKRGIFAGLILIALAGGAVWYILGNREEVKPVEEPKIEAPKTIKVEAPKAKPVAKPVVEVKKPVAKPVKEVVIPPGYIAVTNAGRVLAMTPEEAERFRRAQRDSTLRTRTEKSLRLLASIPPGMPVPPMPFSAADMDKDIMETLNNKIEYLPDETEREKEQKAFVIAFKEYLREEVEKGRKPSEVYSQYVHDMNSVAYLTTDALKQARQMMAEGDTETAEAFVKVVNKKIEALGGNPIDLHKRPKRASGGISE